MDLQQFGSFLQTRRKELMMTQSDLAEKLHVTDKAISRWERGVGFPDIRLLEPLAEALALSLTELMQCRRLENPLPEEQAALEAQTSRIMEEQRKLSWQRKLVLYLGQAVILGIALFLVYISHQKALAFGIRYAVYAVALLGSFFGGMAWNFIVEKAYLRSKPWGSWEKRYKWIGWIMKTAGIMLMVYSNRSGIGKGKLILISLAAALICGAFVYEKLQEENEEETE